MAHSSFLLTWCSWSPWSVCAVEPCQASSNANFRTRMSNPSEVFCVDQLPGEWERKVFLVDENGRRRLVAARQRWRSCNCQSSNPFNIFFKRGCKYKSHAVDCKPCDANRNTVYRTFDGQERLPNCSSLPNGGGFSGQVNSSLYVIIGGVVGAAAFIALLLCCVRFILAEVKMKRRGNSSRSRVNERRHRQLQARDNVNASLGVIPVDVSLCTNTGDLELPPAYKDVVPIIPPPMLNPPKQFTDPHAQPSLTDVCSGVSEVDPSLPTYEEVIACSPIAANMHLHMMNSQEQRANEQSTPLG